MILHLLFFNLKQSLKIILRPHAPFHYSPLDLVFVSCAANLPLYHIVGAILSGYFLALFRRANAKGEASEERKARAPSSVACVSRSMSASCVARPKRKKNSTSSAGYIISNTIRIKYKLVNSLKD